MPYIKQERRDQFEHLEVNGCEPATMERPGDLEYLMAELVMDYVVAKKLSHQTIAEIRGVLHGAVVEFDRRIAFPYENAKLAENGDVYDRR
jgi:hypothetical protein